MQNADPGISDMIVIDREACLELLVAVVHTKTRIWKPEVEKGSRLTAVGQGCAFLRDTDACGYWLRVHCADEIKPIDPESAQL